MTSPEGEAGYDQPPPVYNPGGYEPQQQYGLQNVTHAEDSSDLIQDPQGHEAAAASESQEEKYDGYVPKSGLESVPENYMNVSTASIQILNF